MPVVNHLEKGLSAAKAHQARRGAGRWSGWLAVGLAALLVLSSAHVSVARTVLQTLPTAGAFLLPLTPEELKYPRFSRDYRNRDLADHASPATFADDEPPGAVAAGRLPSPPTSAPVAVSAAHPPAIVRHIDTAPRGPPAALR